MSRFKTKREKALTDARRDQILNDLKTLRQQIIRDIADLEIRSDDYKALSDLNGHILEAGEAISGQYQWGRVRHAIG